MALLGISVLVVFDFWNVDRRYINDENYQRQAVQGFLDPSAADQFIKNNADQHYRVLNLNNPFNEAKTSANHSSLGGYHGAKMKRYQELIENCLSSNLARDDWCAAKWIQRFVQIYSRQYAQCPVFKIW